MTCQLREVSRSSNSCELTGLYDPCKRICYKHYYSFQFPKISNTGFDTVAYGKLFPFLMVLTVATNILIVLVFCRKNMRTVTNLILVMISIADLLVGLIPFPFILIYHGLTRDSLGKPRAMKRAWCYWAKYSMDSLPIVCHSSAVWLTLLLALHRYTCIRFPVNGLRFWTYRKVTISVIALVLLSVVGALPKFLDFQDLQALNFDILNQTEVLYSVHFCMYKPSYLLTVIGQDTYYSSHMWSRVILFSVGPCILLCVLSMLLVREVRRSDLRTSRTRRQSSTRYTGKAPRRMSTMMSTAIVVIFLVVNLPRGLILGLIVITELLKVDVYQKGLLLAITVNNMLILATYPLNFAIYCLMSSNFRDNLRVMFRIPKHQWLCLPSSAPASKPTYITGLELQQIRGNQTNKESSDEDVIWL